MRLPSNTEDDRATTQPNKAAGKTNGATPATQRSRDVVLALLAEITADLAGGPLTPDRRLGDLGLESISLVYLIAEVQQELELGDRLLLALRGEPVDLRTITVGAFTDLAADVAADLAGHRNATPSARAS